MITLAVAFLGAVVAAVGTGMLAARAIRAPRGDLIAWTFAMLGLAVGLGAVAIGSLSGFGPTAFRAMELGGQVLAPLALCLGLAELVGRTVTARFAGRLLLSALAVISLVILATDALTATGSFSKTWPDPSSSLRDDLQQAAAARPGADGRRGRPDLALARREPVRAESGLARRRHGDLLGQPVPPWLWRCPAWSRCSAPTSASGCRSTARSSRACAW